MSNQQRPFSWFRLAPFGRQLQPTPAPTPRPTAFRAPAPQPFSPPAPQSRPTIRPPAPAVTSPPPPTRALFPVITTGQPAPRSPTPSTAPASPIIKLAPSSTPTSPTFLPITYSSFILRSPETKTPAPYSSSLTTNSPFPKTAASPPKSAPPAASPAPTNNVTAPTSETTTLSQRIMNPLKDSPPKYAETKPLFPPLGLAGSAREKEPKGAPMEAEIKKLVLGQETSGNYKMNEKVAELKILPRRLVTLIGENKGAIMVLNPNSTKKSYTNVFGGKSQTVGSKGKGNTVEGEMGSKKKKEDHSDMNTMKMEESTLFINSNVQGVNNSVLDDSSLTHHDPGFHIFFSTD